MRDVIKIMIFCKKVFTSVWRHDMIYLDETNAKSLEEEKNEDNIYKNTDD